MASFATVWQGLDADVRDWLIAHNGEVVDESLRVALPPQWFADDGTLRDEIVDQIEAVANGEDVEG